MKKLIDYFKSLFSWLKTSKVDAIFVCISFVLFLIDLIFRVRIPFAMFAFFVYAIIMTIRIYNLKNN